MFLSAVLILRHADGSTDAVKVPALLEQLSSGVRTVCVGGAELLKVFTWDGETLTIRA